MIKEYIENLPGGKEFIYAQRMFGIVIGVTSIFIINGVTASIAYGDISNAYSKDSAILIMLFSSGFLFMFFSLGGLIKYYSNINKADHKYLYKQVPLGSIRELPYMVRRISFTLEQAQEFYVYLLSKRSLKPEERQWKESYEEYLTKVQQETITKERP